MSKSQSLLQRFYDASLIPTDTTDERLLHYQAAAADLAVRFEETPGDAASASRVAIDPSCPATDPWFNVVEEAVKVHWKTFLTKNHDVPRQICRGILLEALSKVVTADRDATLVIWNAASSLMPHIGDGPEQLITRKFITDLGDECESYSSSEWLAGSKTGNKPPEFQIELPAIKSYQLNGAELLKGLLAASGPHDEEGQALTDSTDCWPDSGETWSHQFAPRAAKVIATTVSAVFAANSKEIKGFADPLAPALKKHTSALSRWIAKSAQRNNQFTSLLWWKQALYSPILMRSYREIPPVGAAIALSYDLSIISSAPIPLSVEYFFREAIRDVVPENTQFTLAELVAASNSCDQIEACLPAVPTGPPHRTSLRQFLSLARQSMPSDELIPTYLGLVPSVRMPLSEWAVWLLRDRLAEILTASEA